MVWHRTPVCPLPACTAGYWGVRVQGGWRLAHPLSMLLRRPVHPTPAAFVATICHTAAFTATVCHAWHITAPARPQTTVGPARAVLPGASSCDWAMPRHEHTPRPES
jgi:hypothetical protein